MNVYIRSRIQMINIMRSFALTAMAFGALIGLSEQAAADQIGVGEEGQTVVTTEDYLCPGNQIVHFILNLDGDQLHTYFPSAASGYTPYMSALHRTRRVNRNDMSIRPDFYRIRFGPRGGDPRPTNQQDVVDGRTGPGYMGVNWDYRHRIVFWVDFNRTPTQPEDDQRFDGYLMTQTENAIAGITWKKGIPVMFALGFHHCD
jgi:hypothetical protein